MSSPAIGLRISGMDCAEEVAVLKDAVGGLVGGADRLGFDLLAGKMTVPAGADLEAVIAAVGRTGMRAAVWRSDGEGQLGTDRRRKALLTVASGGFLVAGFAVHAWLLGLRAAVGAGELAAGGHSVPVVAQLLYLAAVVAGSWFVVPRAWLALRRFRPDMNLLMIIAVAGAIGIGEWFEAATVAFLFALSLAIEAWSVGRARRAVEALMAISPPAVRLRSADGSTNEVAPDAVVVGSRFVVLPGERIGLDGRVESGTSDVDQAPITGESMPVAKAPGAEVFAGTINGNGALVIESTKLAGETTLARILRSVEQARARRSPSEQWVERFARVYTPTVFAAAVAVAVALPLLAGIGWGVAFYRALVLLVIGCPCALVIATPVAVVASLAAAAREGVLIKGGIFVEEPARLTTVAMDKTGTLTHGRPQVVELVPLAEHGEKELLERAAALEGSSEHPLARAILAFAAERGVKPAAAEGFQVLPGKGATGTIAGRQFWLGSHRYLEERNQETPAVHARIEELSEGGKTVVVIGNESHVCGLIALTDGVRPEARRVVRDLHSAGIRRVVMLTGDHAPAAEAVARECGIDEVRSELLPEDKLTAIEELVARDRHVAMIGDGVNDAPALARATVGIAMGAAGSDAAIETADIALMTDDLSRLAWLVRHSRRTLAIVRQNIVFALAVKAIFVVLAFSGIASLWGAIAADMGATLLVVANALRLLGAKPSRARDIHAAAR